MSKVICDICGTSYPDTAEQCPICGCSRDLGAQLAQDGLLMEELRGSEKTPRTKGGHFSSANVRKRNQGNDTYSAADEEEEEIYERPAKAHKPKAEKRSSGNGPLIALLIVVILALLAVTAFIFVRYFLPNMISGSTQQETSQPTEEATDPAEDPTETGIATVPCESLELVSKETVELSEEGQFYLINVQFMPAETTDTLSYASSNELVAVVNSEGRVEAVGEGEATITVTCGGQSVTCDVIVQYTQETEPPTEAPTEPPTEAPTEPETFKVRVTATNLYIRAGAGKNYDYVGGYTAGTEVEILETQEADGVTWGRTDKGWISMDYVEKI